MDGATFAAPARLESTMDICWISLAPRYSTSMSIPMTREALKGLYPKSRKWAAKVDAMEDDQVLAVLFNMTKAEEARRNR
jgi:hypothetical protein